MNDSTAIISTSQPLNVKIIPTAVITATSCTAVDHMFDMSAPMPIHSPSTARFAFWRRSSMSGSSSCSYCMVIVFAIRSCTREFLVTRKPMRSFFAESVFSHIMTNSTAVVPVTSHSSGVMSRPEVPACWYSWCSSLVCSVFFFLLNSMLILQGIESSN